MHGLPQNGFQVALSTLYCFRRSVFSALNARTTSSLVLGM